MGEVAPAVARQWELFNQDKQRSQAIIAQSNNRASGLAQLLAAVVTLIGIVAAVVVAIKDTHMTTRAYTSMGVAAVALVVAMIGLSVVMWPRLGKLPKDASPQAYRQRLDSTAERHPNQGPTDEDYAEGHFLQRISRSKERGTQVTLVAQVVLVVASIITFVSIHY